LPAKKADDMGVGFFHKINGLNQ